MKKWLGFILMLMLGIPSGYVAAATNDSSSNNTTLLFVQTAKGAQMESISGKSGYYTLTLEGASPYITYFSQRPKHTQGVMALEDFIKNWGVGDNSFSNNPPNALITGALIDQNPNKNSVFQLIILESPSYNKNNSKLTFTVRPVSSQQFLYKEMKYYYTLLMIDGVDAKILKNKK